MRHTRFGPVFEGLTGIGRINLGRRALALGCFGAVILGATALQAQSSAPALKVVPMGENPQPKKAPAKKAAPAAKAPAPKAPAPKAAPAAVTPAPKAAPKAATSAPPPARPAPKAAAPASAPANPAASAQAKPAPKPAGGVADWTTSPASQAPVSTPTVPSRASFAPEDWRALNPENTLVYDTTKGRIIVELAPEMAPGHVARVKMLTRQGFYNGLSFHRVVSDFMAQGGDPKGDGTGGSDQPDLKAEFNFRRGSGTNFVRAVDRGGASIGWIGTIPVTTQIDALMERTSDKRVAAWGNHCPGVASMARSSEEDSANSQFFLMRAAYPTLDRRYTIWGRAVIGLDVIRSFKVGEPVVDPDRMLQVRVLADIPEADRPVIMVQRTDGPAFQARLKATLEQRGAAFSNCDLTPEARLAR
ncbi:putative peptidyl-prolyl cis-trans isomerase [Candidatus Phycosocius bacilliformis]|uniref:peptidylprolyl isomerase n=1 Tax=Candidatus Phycosocius bacilliformis TaxID=1445552 RepID=A0A2P2E7P1_9PROT|nr:peptidylprolyl isomerase [Candidatus Phycosocius bacilliformis]GBF57085.1 putative peptidyl-prolyl cis-trans isomerase [Candidatus Phycosocius bacilliformis]